MSYRDHVVDASYIIWKDGTLYLARNGLTGVVDYSGTDAATVMSSALNASSCAGIFIKKGTYYLSSLIMAITNSGIKISGESEGSTILDFSGMPAPTSGTIPNNQYAGIVLHGTGLQLSDLTFANYAYPFVGVGISVGGSLPASNCTVRNIYFSGATNYGIAFYDGSGSLIENVRGDNPFNIVSFWYGTQSNITVKKVLMKPLLGAYTTAPDDAMSFNPEASAVCDNVVLEDIVGDYGTYFSLGGTSNAIGGVIDFAGFGGHSFKNVKVNHVIGNRACALYAGGYACVGIADSEFRDIHSKYAFPSGSIGTGLTNGAQIFLAPTSADVVMANITVDGVYIDHAYGTGLSFVMSGGAPNTGSASVFGVTLKNLYLTDNNQRATTVISAGCAGLDIGNTDSSALSNFDGVTVENIFAKDDQGATTQQYPCVLWNYGLTNSALTNVTVAFGEFKGNVNNFIGTTGNRAIPDPTVRDVDGYVNENDGTTSFSGNGTTTAFSVAHGLASSPSVVDWKAKSVDSAGDAYWSTTGAATFAINFITPPVSGTNNVSFSWEAVI